MLVSAIWRPPGPRLGGPFYLKTNRDFKQRTFGGKNEKRENFKILYTRRHWGASLAAFLAISGDALGRSGAAWGALRTLWDDPFFQNSIFAFCDFWSSLLPQKHRSVFTILSLRSVIFRPRYFVKNNHDFVSPNQRR